MLEMAGIRIIYHEDMAVLAPWLRKVIELHGLYSRNLPPNIRVMMHVRPAASRGKEVDLIVRGMNRVVLIELKDSDLYMATEQAIERRELADYTYVALRLPAYQILSILRGYTRGLENGIGYISTLDDSIVVRAYMVGHEKYGRMYKSVTEALSRQRR